MKAINKARNKENHEAENRKYKRNGEMKKMKKKICKEYCTVKQK